MGSMVQILSVFKVEVENLILRSLNLQEGEEVHGGKNSKGGESPLPPPKKKNPASGIYIYI